MKPADTDTDFAAGRRFGEGAATTLQPCCRWLEEAGVCKDRIHVERIDNVGLMVPADSQTFCHFSLLFRPSVGVSGTSKLQSLRPYESYYQLLADLGA